MESDGSDGKSSLTDLVAGESLSSLNPSDNGANAAAVTADFANYNMARVIAKSYMEDQVSDDRGLAYRMEETSSRSSSSSSSSSSSNSSGTGQQQLADVGAIAPGAEGNSTEEKNEDRKLVLVMRASSASFVEEKAEFPAGLLGGEASDFEVWPLMDVVKGRAWPFSDKEEQLLRTAEDDDEDTHNGLDVLFFSMCKAVGVGSNQRRLTPTPVNAEDAEFGVKVSDDIDVTDVFSPGNLLNKTVLAIDRMKSKGNQHWKVVEEDNPESANAASKCISEAVRDGNLILVKCQEAPDKEYGGSCSGIIVVPAAVERDAILTELDRRKKEQEEQEEEDREERVGLEPEKVIYTMVHLYVDSGSDNEEDFGEHRIGTLWPKIPDALIEQDAEPSWQPGSKEYCKIEQTIKDLLDLVEYRGKIDPDKPFKVTTVPCTGKDNVQRVTVYGNEGAKKPMEVEVAGDEVGTIDDRPFPEQEDVAHELFLKAAACLLGVEESAQAGGRNGVGSGASADGAAVGLDTGAEDEDAVMVDKNSSTAMTVEAASELLGRKYDKMCFAIFVPNFKSLQTQTQERVEAAAGIGPGAVLRFYNGATAKGVMKELLEAAKQPKTLVVLIADECHNAPTKGGAHDKLLNDEGLAGRRNVLKLLVSATPQNCLTKSSRVDEKNVVSWSKPVTLYRSMEYYIETITWAAPPQVKFWVGEHALFDLVGYRFAPGDPRGLVAALNCKLRSTWDKTPATQGMGKKPPTFEVVSTPPGVVSGEQVGRRLRLRISKKIVPEPRNFDPKTGLLAWLGFTCEDAWGVVCPIEGKRTAIVEAGHKHSFDLVEGESHASSQGVPAKGTDCLPRKSQRVRVDRTFDKLLMKYLDTFGERKGQKGRKLRKGENMVSKSTPLFNGHFLLVDYLISFAFMGVYRVRPIDERSVVEDGNVPTMLLDLGCEAPSKLTSPGDLTAEALLDDFAAAVGLSFGKAGGFDEAGPAGRITALDKAAREKSVMYFKWENGEEGEVQHVANRALAAMESSAYEEWRESEAYKEWAKNKPGAGEIVDEGVRREVWRYILLNKLQDNAKELSETPANDSETWFTDTDRIVQNLLDVDPVSYTGRMCVVRVYETDENMSIQDALRSAMKKLGLEIILGGAGRKKRNIISVVGDIGGTTKNTSVAAYEGSSIYRQLEPWAREADLRDPDDVGRRDSRMAALTVHSMAKVRQLRASNGNINEGEASKARSRGTLSSTYADLNNLPVIVILCDKGRMGDTFPDTFRYFDLRLRASEVYSSFVQEFGRVCRYPKLHDAKEKLAVGPEVEARISELLKTADGNTGKSLVQHFASGSSVVVEDPDGKLAFHADSSGQLRRRLLDGVSARPACENEGEDEGEWAILRYKHCLPTVLVPAKRFKTFVAAVDLKYGAGQGVPDVVDCIAGTIDAYVSSGKKANRSILVDKDGELRNDMHSVPYYMECTDVKEKHYDTGNKTTDPTRLLLKAQCQQGKTGTYLHLLRLLKRAVQPLPDLRFLLDPVIVGDRRLWDYPYWHDLAKEPPMPYNKPHVGQYHKRVMLQRLQVLHLSEAKGGSGWAKDYVYEYLLHHSGECITSSKGIAAAKALLEKYEGTETAHPTTGTISGDEKEVAWACVNYDGRMEGPDSEHQAKLFEQLENPKFLAGIPSRGGLKLAQCAKEVQRLFDNSKQSREPDVGGVVAHQGASHCAVQPQSEGEAAERRRKLLEVAATTVGPTLRKEFSEKPVCFKELRFNFSEFPSLGGEGPVSISLSLPRAGLWGSGPAEGFFNIVDGDDGTKELRGLTKAGSGLKWAFVPSYNRAGRAYFDYSKAVSEDERKLRVFVLVVRSGSDFDAYVQHYGSLHVVLGMPTSLPIARAEDMDGSESKPVATVTAASSGIGFSRYFVQVFASTLQLKWVWMLDDNVYACFKRNIESEEAAVPKPCRFDEVMEPIERMMAGPPPLGDGEGGEAAIDPPESLIRKKEPAPRLGAAATTPKEVMGGEPSRKYGLVGIRRDPAGSRKESQKPFMVSYSVYSFVYINIEATVANGVIYPPKVPWQDIEFNHLVDESGLVCLKANQYFHNKINLKIKIDSPEPKPHPKLGDVLGERGPLYKLPRCSFRGYADEDRWAERVFEGLDKLSVGLDKLFVGIDKLFVPGPSALCIFMEWNGGDATAILNDAGIIDVHEAEVVVIVHRDKDKDALTFDIDDYTQQSSVRVTHRDSKLGDLELVVVTLSKKVQGPTPEPGPTPRRGEKRPREPLPADVLAFIMKLLEEEPDLKPAAAVDKVRVKFRTIHGETFPNLVEEAKIKNKVTNEKASRKRRNITPSSSSSSSSTT